MIEKRLNYSHLQKSVKDSSSAIYLFKVLKYIVIFNSYVNLRTNLRTEKTGKDNSPERINSRKSSGAIILAIKFFNFHEYHPHKTHLLDTPNSHLPKRVVSFFDQSGREIFPHYL